jgi:hypothetical protein
MEKPEPHQVAAARLRMIIPRNAKPIISLMLDSGAFSAWNRGETLELKDYIAYLKQIERYLFSYVVMDVLPFGKEAERTGDAIEKAAAQSYRHLQIMKDAGLKPMPVYHQGERMEWLEKMISDGERYIGISTRKDLQADKVASWLDEVFLHLTTRDGKPIVKLHGFGITKPAFLLRYPWFTTDSTTWSLNSGYGRIPIPAKGQDGKPDYRNPISVHISGVQQGVNFTQTGVYDAMGDIQQQWVIDYLDMIGLKPADVRYFPIQRRKAYLHFYLELSKLLNDVTFRYHKASKAQAKMLVKREPFRMMFATLARNRSFSEELGAMSANNRLLSYFELKALPPEKLIQYVMRGGLDTKIIRKSTKVDWDSEAYLNKRRAIILQRSRASAEPRS